MFFDIDAGKGTDTGAQTQLLVRRVIADTGSALLQRLKNFSMAVSEGRDNAHSRYHDSSHGIFSIHFDG